MSAGQGEQRAAGWAAGARAPPCRQRTWRLGASADFESVDRQLGIFVAALARRLLEATFPTAVVSAAVLSRACLVCLVSEQAVLPLAQLPVWHANDLLVGAFPGIEVTRMFKGPCRACCGHSPKFRLAHTTYSCTGFCAFPPRCLPAWPGCGCKGWAAALHCSGHPVPHGAAK